MCESVSIRCLYRRPKDGWGGWRLRKMLLFIYEGQTRICAATRQTSRSVWPPGTTALKFMCYTAARADKL